VEVKLNGYIDALELTVIALGALLLISLCFIGLTRGLQWLVSLRKGKEGSAKTARRKAIIAAAVRSYLESDKRGKNE